MTEVCENSTAVDRGAVGIVDDYDRSVRNAVWYIVSGVGAYALIMGMWTLLSWWFDLTGTDGGESSELRFSFTLDLSEGAAVLGVLTALIIALHVVAWQIKPSGPLANLAHARRKLLSEIAGPIGFVAVITGAATLLHDAPDTFGVGSLAVAAAAVVVAVLAADIRSVLDTNRDIYRQVDDVSRQRDAAALGKVADLWSTTREANAVATLKDLAQVTALTAIPLVTMICTTAGSRAGAESLRNLGIAALVAAAWVTVSTFAVYGGVLHFVTRNHFNFLLCVLTAACLIISWLVTGLTVWASTVEFTTKLAATVALLWFAAAPSALIGYGLGEDVPARMPGSSARPNLHGALEKRHQRLVPQEQDNEPTETKEPGRISRIAHWYKIVTGTGTAPEKSTSAQTDDSADDQQTTN
ncbi:hypothetical protein [Rhodococcus sp. W8901]|uniref:hypothetical protein n=1 Tax=Rhodococcus sp. W8901 TaxID=2742603 RepID=UPI0015840E0F|nr:hypothetical protein [Rhodococcus sp. W8901]QKT09468.1 hypothetical protein HUN07_00810 [Rhodococcus sp. W8901]